VVKKMRNIFLVTSKKVKLHKLLIQKHKFVKYRIQSTSGSVSLSWSVNNQEGSIIWNITNNTNQIQSVALYRGVPGYSPLYIFGEAFNMVYLANNLVSPCSSLDQEFCLGIMAYNNFMRFPAFVFNLQPMSSYQITEYGFPPNPNIIAELIKLNPIGLVNTVVYYDPILPQMYMSEIGQQVPYEPDPFTLQTIAYNMEKNILNSFGYLVLNNISLMNNMVIKTIYEYFLLSLPLPISII